MRVDKVRQPIRRRSCLLSSFEQVQPVQPRPGPQRDLGRNSCSCC